MRIYLSPENVFPSLQTPQYASYMTCKYISSDILSDILTSTAYSDLLQYFPTVNNIGIRSHIVPSLGTPSILGILIRGRVVVWGADSVLDLVTLQDTQNTASTNTNSPPAASKSCCWRKKSTHCQTAPHNHSKTIGSNLLIHPALAIPKASTSPQNSPKQPWVPHRTPHLSSISMLCSTTILTKIVSLMKYLTP